MDTFLQSQQDEAELLTAFMSHMSNLTNSAAEALKTLDSSSGEARASEKALREELEQICEDALYGSRVARETEEQVLNNNRMVLSAVVERFEAIQRLMDAKRTAQAQILDDVSAIASKLSMLAINAGIEAARAGDSGKAFGVVATEVQRLADQTLSKSKSAADQIDMSDIVEQMRETVQSSQTATDNSQAEIADGFGKVSMTFDAFEERLDRVLRLSESALGNTEEVHNRGRIRISWAADRLAKITRARKNAIDADATTKELLRSDGINYASGYDRLIDIRRRGALRVGIEPDFIGLSFRQAPNKPLKGLDVEYARAFAEHLGVRCDFVEAPWDTLPETLRFGPDIGQAPADIIISALPPDPGYRELAYSETYTYLPWVLARRSGDQSIRGLDDLGGRTLGIINDPGAFRLLEDLGVRWPDNQDVPGGTIFLKALIAYSDQTKIHDCLADGMVDAFGVDLPIYYWACTSSESRWYGKIEICTDNLASDPYYYTAAVLAERASYSLLAEFNTFLAEFKNSSKRAQLEDDWQGSVLEHTLSYRDEPGSLIGAPELLAAS